MPPKRLYSEPARHAMQLLGAQVREGRTAREWTVRDLAERAGVSKNTVVKVEHGDPAVAIGIVLDLAALVGVPLFSDDRSRLATEAARARERLALLPRRVHPSKDEPDYDF